MTKNFILTGCIVGALSILSSCGDTSAKEVQEVVQETFKRNPKEVVNSDDVSLEIYDFENFEPFLYQEDDKIHVINFWATWCVPCVQELPYFERIHQEQADIEVILVSLDFRKAVESDLIPFIKENDLKCEVIMLHETDANSWIPKVNKDWSGAIPATVIYKEEEREFYEQSFTFEELENEIQKFK